MKKINQKGFTLIEIIVVVVILAVLMAVGVPSVTKYINEANDAKLYPIVRSYMNDIQIATVKAKMDAGSDTMKWSEFEQLIVDNLNEGGFVAGFFGKTVCTRDTELYPQEGYYVKNIIFSATDGTNVYSCLDWNYDYSSESVNVDDIYFTEYVFFISEEIGISKKNYTFRVVPNGKIERIN